MSNARELAQIPSTPSGRRNLIINGAMNVAQRGTSITNFTVNNQYHTVDRFIYEAGGISSVDFAQVTDAPSGFKKSLKATLNGTFTPSAGQYFIPFEHRIESQDVVFLDYGTANAKTVTLSFWIKSNKTGTYVVEFSNASINRKWSQSYTINAANTWEQKIITWTGDTGAGTSFTDDSGIGATFFWWMSGGTTFTSGSLSGAWQDGNNADRAVGVPSSLADDDQFYLTGVQLEVGTVATEFEHRSFGEELQLCQRYYYELNNTDDFRYVAGLTGRSTNTAYSMGQLHMTPMRTSPSVSSLGLAVYRGDIWRDVTATGAGAGRYGWGFNPNFATDSGCTDGTALMLYLNAIPSYIKFDAEL